MKKQVTVTGTLAAMALLAVTMAQAAIPIPAPPSVNARAYVLIDSDSGRVLVAGNSTERMEPASLTKLMTAYVVFNELRAGNIKLDDPVRISERAWRMPGSRSFVQVNTRLTTEELLKGMIVQSGNDASVALAEHVAGSEDAFADLMNSHARALNMTGTHFINSTGLPDPQHYTTAQDLALLTQAMIRQFPDYYRWYSIKEYSHNGITQQNRNRLLWRDPTVDGVKTGHTETAGYCLVTSALRDNMRLITVVLGTKSDETRVQETQKLLNYGFRFFETHLLFSAATPVTQTRIWQGQIQDLPLGLAQDLYITIPRNEFSKVASVMNVNDGILAPVHKGDQLGSMEVQLDGDGIATRPLIAIQDAEEGGFARRIADRVLMFFQ